MKKLLVVLMSFALLGCIRLMLPTSTEAFKEKQKYTIVSKRDYVEVYRDINRAMGALIQGMPTQPYRVDRADLDREKKTGVLTLGYANGTMVTHVEVSASGPSETKVDYWTVYIGLKPEAINKAAAGH